MDNNRTLKVLDISWNRLGCDDNKSNSCSN